MLLAGLLASVEHGLNRVLRLDSTALPRLAPLDGKVIAIDCRQPALQLFILPSDEGLLLASQWASDADCTLRAPASSLVQLALSQDKTAVLHSPQVELDGDSAVLLDLFGVLQDLELDWEYEVSRWLGPVATQLLSGHLRSRAKWTRQSLASLSLTASEYLAEESRTLVGLREAEARFSELDALKLDIERLEARVERLARSLESSDNAGSCLPSAVCCASSASSSATVSMTCCSTCPCPGGSPPCGCSCRGAGCRANSSTGAVAHACAWRCRTWGRSSSSSASCCPRAATCCRLTSPMSGCCCKIAFPLSIRKKPWRSSKSSWVRRSAKCSPASTSSRWLRPRWPRFTPHAGRAARKWWSRWYVPVQQPVIAQDLAWLFLIARGAERVSADARLLHPVEVVSDYEKTIYDELDLLREAANASQLKRNFEGSDMMYVPQVYWDWCRPKVLVMERIYGIQVTDLETLADQRTDMKMLAERGVEIFFTQVFRDSFFHADMHPGNIFVSTVKPWSPQYIAIDCGIVGSLTPEDQDYLARNLFAFFKRDYRRVAQLHIDSGWVPAQTKLNEFEAAIRTVCEPIFEKPLKDISFGQVLMRLFQTARRFNMEVQPQLVLLQKTLLNIEGLGRQLYPDLDLWTTAQPFLERWMRERVSPKNLLQNLHSQVEQVPHLANMTRDLLERMSQPHLNDPPAPWKQQDHWALRLLGAALLAGGATLAAGAESLSAAGAWPAWLMLAAGLYLVVRR